MALVEPGGLARAGQVCDAYLIYLIRIRIQHFRLNTDPDLDPIRIQGFDDQNFDKIYSWKKIIKYSIYLIKNCNLPIPKPPYRTPKL